MFVGPVPEDKLPKDATAGRSLAGTLQLGLQQGSTKEYAPASVPLMYRYAFGACLIAMFWRVSMSSFMQHGSDKDVMTDILFT